MEVLQCCSGIASLLLPWVALGLPLGCLRAALGSEWYFVGVQLPAVTRLCSSYGPAAVSLPRVATVSRHNYFSQVASARIANRQSPIVGGKRRIVGLRALTPCIDGAA